MNIKTSDYPRAMLVDMLEFKFDPVEFGVIHTGNPNGYDVTWFDGPSRVKVRDYLQQEFAKFRGARIGLSRKLSSER